MNNDKIKKLAIVIFGGPFGLHKFLNGEIGMGIIYLCTGGLFFIGWIKDIVDLLKTTISASGSNSLMGRIGIQTINEGKLPNIQGTNLNLIDDETCCYMDKAYTFKDKTITTGYTGKHNGVSIRIAKGLSYHTGASGSQAIRQTQRTTYNGILYLTTRRIIYTSQNESFDKTFDKITSIQEAKDGLIIQIGSNTYSIVTNTHSEFMKVFELIKQINYSKKESIRKLDIDDEKLEDGNLKDNEVKHNKIRNSKAEFTFIDENMILKYAYYDVEVKGTNHRNFDITKIGLDKEVKFEFEPNNEYDKNAIKIIYDGMHIGYVPKNNMQKMIKDFINNEDKKVEAFIRDVNEESKEIHIYIGFYVLMTDEELEKIEHIDTSLIKTTKKEEFGSSRQENLDLCSVGDELDLDYQYETETYLVRDSYGNELGEINLKNSETLQEAEDDGRELYAMILKLDETDSGNITCKIRVFIK